MPLIRSISGLRATIDDFLTEELIVNYSKAFDAILSPGPIVVGRDGRPSGEWIEKLIAGTLAGCGRDVRIIGIVPTPTVQLMVEDSDAAGGIAITASHNPTEWNGLKFIGSDGVFLDESKNRELWEVLDSRNFSESERTGEILEVDNALDIHIDKILKLKYISNNIIAIISSSMKIVVDAVNASGSLIVPKLLSRLGNEVIQLFCDGSGIFPHTPEPIPENLSLLGEAVLRHKADFGIAVDPDADRLVIVGCDGKPIGEELTISIAVEAVLSSAGHNDAAVVVNLSTTRLVHDIAEKYGAKFYRSPVGEINVVNKMRELKACIGGEGSGGVILPECHYGRDSLVGIALLISLLAVRKTSISEIIDEFPKYEIVKTKKEFTGAITDLIKKIVPHFSDANVNLEDGIRFDFPKSWVQLRESNTEPIIRIIAEAPSHDEAKELINRINNLL